MKGALCKWNVISWGGYKTIPMLKRCHPETCSFAGEGTS
jgi:hypothetical protein